MQAHALNIIKQSTTRHTRFIIYLLPTFAASACEVSHNIELVMLKVLLHKGPFSSQKILGPFDR